MMAGADYRGLLVPHRSHQTRPLLRWLAAVAIGVITLFTGLSLGGVGPRVHAVNSLVSSEPADGAELDSAPTSIVLMFDEELGDNNLVVLVCSGNPVSTGAIEVGSDRTQLTAAITGAVPAAECNVTWTVTDSEDVDNGSDNFSFRVNAGATGAAVDPTATAADGSTPATIAPSNSGSVAGDSSTIRNASTVSSAPIWLGRFLSILGLSVLFGSLVLIVAAWPEGPEYVLALRFLRMAWIVGAVGSLIYLVALSAAVKGESFGGGLNPSSWFDLFDAGWAGRAAVLRLVFVLASAWVVIKPERVIDPTTNMLALGIPALAFVTLGLSRTGGTLAFIGVIASITHVLAMAVWFGAAVLLARVVLAGPGEEDLVHAVRGFGRISTSAIVLTVVSGLVQLLRLDGGELFSTGHGRVLLFKTLGVAGMMFFGMTALHFARARLHRSSELSLRNADRLRRAFGTEAVIGLVVIALSGWMMSFSPGKIDDPSQGDYAIFEPITDAERGLDLDVFMSPGRVGLNELRVVVRIPETGLSGLRLTLLPPIGADTPAIIQDIELTTAGVASSPEGGGVPLLAAGSWTLSLEAVTPSGTVSARTAFEVRNADGSAAPTDVEVAPLPATTTTPPAAPATSTSDTST
ncbi:hypothetical protein BH24ACT5_BH24ACT5_28390 [soil metagenome]